MAIDLIVGLGNPGSRYAATRHNAGFWFLERLQGSLGFSLASEKRFHAEVGDAVIGGHRVRIVAPATFMNESGKAIAPLVSFFRIAPERMLVVHDELDLAPGCARIKRGGGHGGHNGLRDLIARLGNSDFVRLRIGIGHPGPQRDVSGFVLNKPDATDRALIDDALARALAVIDEIVGGDLDAAMLQLHSDADNKN